MENAVHRAGRYSCARRIVTEWPRRLCCSGTCECGRSRARSRRDATYREEATNSMPPSETQTRLNSGRGAPTRRMFTVDLGEVTKFVRAAIEASVYIAPTDPGLTRQEIETIGKEAGFLPGELGDAIQRLDSRPNGNERALPDAPIRTLWLIHRLNDPEYRNFAAFDFVISALQLAVRSEGADRTTGNCSASRRSRPSRT